MRGRMARRIARMALACVPLGVLAACSSNDGDRLPPPPVASFGDELAALAGTDPLNEPPPSYGGVGAPNVSGATGAIARSVTPPPTSNTFATPDTTYTPAAPGGTPGASALPGAPAGFPTEVPGAPTGFPQDAGTPAGTTPAPFPAPPVAPGSQPGTIAAPGPQPMPSGPFRWVTTWAEASAAARNEGKVVLAFATKPNCGMCDQVKDQVMPQTFPQLAPVAIGYLYDVTTPESPQLNAQMYANLPGASLMPLVGFFNADMQWLRGFWGGRTVAEFQQDIAAVAPMAPGPSMGAPQPMPQPGTPSVFPAPQPGVAQIPPPSGSPWLGQALPAPSAPAPLTGSGAQPGVWMPSAPSNVPAAPVAQPPVSGTSFPPELASAAPQLELALSQIRGKRYDAALHTLSQIQQRAPGTAAAREAAKGTIAVYNAKRIDRAESEFDRERYVQRARQDLQGTIWSGLFG